MAPRTVGGLARGMTHNSHISHENYEFIGIEGPKSASAFSRGPDLCLGDLDSMVHSGHTLRTTLGGCILESTHIGGQHPLSSSSASKLTERSTVASSKSPSRWGGQHPPTPNIPTRSYVLEARTPWPMAGKPDCISYHILFSYIFENSSNFLPFSSKDRTQACMKEAVAKWLREPQ